MSSFDVTYGITRRLSTCTVPEAKAIVTDALKGQGFGVLTEIDIAATLRAKLGVEREPYVILGACNPQLAHRALGEMPAIGLLLPCNVVLAQDGPDVVVSAVSPRAMFAIVGDATSVAPIAAEAEQRLTAALDSAARRER